MNNLSLITTYFQGYSTETTLLQTYRGIFLALEAILFAGACAIKLRSNQGNEIEILFFFIVAIGSLFLILWGIVCEGRSSRAEKWRKEITSLDTTKCTPADKFRKLCKVDWSITLARVSLNYIMPGFLAGAWVAVLLINVNG